MKQHTINTPLGTMIAVGDNQYLYTLGFEDQRHFNSKPSLAIGETVTTRSIEEELNHYFEGELTAFKTPIHTNGTAFQEKAWLALTQIPYGETHSYLEQARAVGNPKAYRAVANANSKNPLAILVPCHRVVNHSGKLGGYAGGLDRKRWLLAHEQAHR